MRCCQIPCVSAESLKACALIGLLLLAAGGKAESMVVNLLVWEICGGTLAQNALTGTATLKQCEHNVESLALNAVRQDQSGEKEFPLPRRLGTCEGGFELTLCPGCVAPGNA